MGNRRNNYYDATIRRMVQESLEQKENAFLSEHEQDSDEALAQYLRESAAGLGHTPHEKEILGTELILRRFGSWQEAIKKAGLNPPNTPNKPTRFQRYILEEQAQKKLYAQKKAQKKEAARIRETERAKKRAEHSDPPARPEIIN